MHVRMRAHDAATGVVIYVTTRSPTSWAMTSPSGIGKYVGAPGIVAMRSQKIDARPLGWCAWPNTPSLRPSNSVSLSAMSRDSSRMLRWSGLF